MERELKKPLALVRQLQKHTPAVSATRFALDEPCFLAPIAQLHRCIVAQTETLRYITHGRGRPVGCAGDLEQQLMLLRLQPELFEPHSR